MPKKPRPEGVVQSDVQVVILQRILAEVYSDLLAKSTQGSLHTQARRIALAKEVEDMMAEYGRDMQAWADVTVPEFYRQGMDRVIKEAIDQGIPLRLNREFIRIHKQALNQLIASGYEYIDNIIAGANATTQNLIDTATRQAIVDEVAKGTVTGEARDKISKNIEELLKAKGVTVIRSDGRQYNAQSYAKMLSRSLLTEAQWNGTRNQMVMEGHDLVVVSDHFGECRLCRPWENEILSVNGMYPQYTRLDTAISQGLKHSNCGHVIDPYYEEFASVSKVWDAKQQKYVPWQEAEPQNYERATKLDAKDKLKAFESYTSQIGLDDYESINKALNEKNTESLEYYAKKQKSKQLTESIRRLKKYI